MKSIDNIPSAGVSEKTTHNFGPLSYTEYVVLFVERFMACEVRCWVTDRQTDRQKDTHDSYHNPRCACAPRVNSVCMWRFVRVRKEMSREVIA